MTPVGCVRLYYPVEVFRKTEREALADVLSTIAADIKKSMLEPDTWFISLRIDVQSAVGDIRVGAVPVDDRAGTAE